MNLKQNDDFYKQKYLKYKDKYIRLKEMQEIHEIQKGGGVTFTMYYIINDKNDSVIKELLNIERALKNGELYDGKFKNAQSNNLNDGTMESKYFDCIVESDSRKSSFGDVVNFKYNSVDSPGAYYALTPKVTMCDIIGKNNLQLNIGSSFIDVFSFYGNIKNNAKCYDGEQDDNEKIKNFSIKLTDTKITSYSDLFMDVTAKKNKKIIRHIQLINSKFNQSSKSNIVKYVMVFASLNNINYLVNMFGITLKIEKHQDIKTLQIIETIETIITPVKLFDIDQNELLQIKNKIFEPDSNFKKIYEDLTKPETTSSTNKKLMDNINFISNIRPEVKNCYIMNICVQRYLCSLLNPDNSKCSYRLYIHEIDIPTTPPNEELKVTCNEAVNNYIGNLLQREPKPIYVMKAPCVVVEQRNKPEDIYGTIFKLNDDVFKNASYMIFFEENHKSVFDSNKALLTNTKNLFQEENTAEVTHKNITPSNLVDNVAFLRKFITTLKIERKKIFIMIVAFNIGGKLYYTHVNQALLNADEQTGQYKL